MKRVYTERSRSGFTLIEMMVVVVVLAILAMIGSNMLSSILRGSTKTQTMLMVKQQGEFASLVMERMIRNARSIDYAESGSDKLTIYGPDSMPTKFSCGSNISSNSAVLTSTDVAVSDCLFTITPGQAGAYPDTVKIYFKLSPSIAGVRPEEQSTVTFDTTVSLRNY